MAANCASWMIVRSQPIDLFIVASLLGALVGTSVARTFGSRRAWLGGLLWAFAADALWLAALSVWLPRALLEIVGVG